MAMAADRSLLHPRAVNVTEAVVPTAIAKKRLATVSPKAVRSSREGSRNASTLKRVTIVVIIRLPRFMTSKLNAFNPRRESPAFEAIPRKPYDTYTFRRPRAISKVKRIGARSSSPSIGAVIGSRLRNYWSEWISNASGPPTRARAAPRARPNFRHYWRWDSRQRIGPP